MLLFPRHLYFLLHRVNQTEKKYPMRAINFLCRAMAARRRRCHPPDIPSIRRDRKSNRLSAVVPQCGDRYRLHLTSLSFYVVLSLIRGNAIKDGCNSLALLLQLPDDDDDCLDAENIRSPARPHHNMYVFIRLSYHSARSDVNWGSIRLRCIVREQIERELYRKCIDYRICNIERQL